MLRWFRHRHKHSQEDVLNASFDFRGYLICLFWGKIDDNSFSFESRNGILNIEKVNAKLWEIGFGRISIFGKSIFNENLSSSNSESIIVLCFIGLCKYEFEIKYFGGSIYS